MSPFFEHPIAYAVPERLTAHSAWKSHVPFAMALTALHRPRSIVELGTQGGDSYCAFCQALSASNVEAEAMAVDTWEGDEQTGFYGPDVLAGLRAHHDPRYGSFSRLVQARFEDARTEVPDGSVDLLHIDGRHGEEAVRHDWETWRSTLSERGVLLLHDTEERADGFGVYRLFQELATQYPSFAFFHGHGLAVVGVGSAIDGPARALFESSETEARRLRLFFQRLGELVVARFEAEAHARGTSVAEAARQQALAALASANEELAETRRRLQEETRAREASSALAQTHLEALEAASTQLDARTAEVERTAATLSRSEASRAELEEELRRARSEGQQASDSADAANRARDEAFHERDEAVRERDEALRVAAECRALAKNAEVEGRSAARAQAEAEDSARSVREALEAERREAEQRAAALARTVEALTVERDALRAERDEWTESVRRMRGLEEELALLREDRTRVEHSVGFRAVALQRRLVDRLLPHGTRRRGPYLRATTAVGRWLRSPTAAAPATPARRPPPPEPASPRPPRVRSPLIELTFAPIDVPVSVVVPTKNGEAEGLARGLRAFRQQEGLSHPIELFVVDSGSTDGTQAIAREAGATLHVIDPATFNHGATRNLAAARCAGELVLFSVQDAVPGHPTLVQELADMLLGGDLAVVSAKQLTRADADPYCAFSLFHHYRALGDRTRVTPAASQSALAEATGERRWQLGYVDDVCALHQRRVFDQLQYRPMSYGEDLEYGIRCVAAGYGLGFYADGGVVHSHLRSATYQLKTHYVVRRDLGPLLGEPRALDAADPSLGGLIGAGRRAFRCLAAVRSSGGARPPGPSLRACIQHLRHAPAKGPAESGDSELDSRLHALSELTPAGSASSLLETMAATLEGLALPFLETTYPALEPEALEDFVRKNISATLGAALGNWAARHPESSDAQRLREVLS